MGTHTTKVWLVAAACILPWCAASLCPPGLQYWSNDSDICINCSKCDAAAKYVVIRPCQAHADTVCGPISDLNIDWSWLKSSPKNHGKKNHKHIVDLGDDLLIDDNLDALPVKENKHRGKKHQKHELSRFMVDEFQDEGKHSKKHHIPSESLLSEDFELSSERKAIHHHSPPPPQKNTDDLEREWKKLLVQSRKRLEHEKDDLLKHLLKEKIQPFSEKHHSNVRINKPIGSLQEASNSLHNYHNNHEKHFSPLELKLFDRLLSHQQERLSISHLLSEERRQSEERDQVDDSPFLKDAYEFRSAIPTHRLFLGEPSTVSEIMDEDLSEDIEDESILDNKEPDVVAVPFTATERLIWDWQAIALASAVAACLLFFSVVAIFSLLQARHWKKMKVNTLPHMEELSAKVGLMSTEGANTNVHLENLLENKKQSSNIYTQKQPLS